MSRLWQNSKNEKKKKTKNTCLEQGLNNKVHCFVLTNPEDWAALAKLADGIKTRYWENIIMGFTIGAKKLRIYKPTIQCHLEGCFDKAALWQYTVNSNMQIKIKSNYPNLDKISSQTQSEHDPINTSNLTRLYYIW